MARKWAAWLHNPRYLRGPQCLKAGDKITSGPKVAGLATEPLLSKGSPTPESRGQNQKWPTIGLTSYKIRSGPQVGALGMETPTIQGTPTLQSEEQNQKCPTSGRIGYITLAV